MLTRALFLSTIAGGLLFAAPASADPKHCPPGHAKKGWCSADYGYYVNDDYRQRDRDRLRDAYEQGYRDGQRNAWRVGDRLDRDYRVLRDYGDYGLRRPPQGYYYAETSGEILLIEAATQVISALVNQY
ncbi:hypothetical protein FF098_001665 [Parvularcula flava]|uniref:Uncharacterized protein n=1 Tax=Aquisalinus luteolus TaxID=1566827 RepID=A0A8J3ET52_9PROT|nr:RcnB family protein [Aquisalinus luteolus]NHK26612.1 hypothetical protein [Aquisalinus luteolus]GGH92874.1 hypothetical protein GCM10011355_03390 [Aquisalinus luteolus]